MDLSMSETEQMLAASVREFVDRAAAKEVLVDLNSRNAASPTDWAATMAAAGWLGLLVSTELAGSGASAVEAAIYFHELGRAPFPVTWLLSSGVSAPIIASAPKSADRDAALTELATGQAVIVPGFQPAGHRWSGISPIQTGPTLTTELVYVCGLRDATHLLVPISCDGDEFLALVPTDDASMSSRHLTGFLVDSYAVSVKALDLATTRLLPCHFGDNGLDHGLALAATMISAYQVGSSERLLEISIAHANERVQFGQPIGTFQRVQDHIVRLVNSLDSARWLLYDALAKPADRAFEAKAWLARAAAIDAHWECANAVHEVLAGIGSDPAHGTVLHTAMSRLLHTLLGDSAYCRRQHAQAAGWLESAN